MGLQWRKFEVGDIVVVTSSGSYDEGIVPVGKTGVITRMSSDRACMVRSANGPKWEHDSDGKGEFHFCLNKENIAHVL